MNNIGIVLPFCGEIATVGHHRLLKIEYEGLLMESFAGELRRVVIWWQRCLVWVDDSQVEFRGKSTQAIRQQRFTINIAGAHQKAAIDTADQLIAL